MGHSIEHSMEHSMEHSVSSTAVASVFFFNCFALYPRTQLSPTIILGPTKHPEDSSIAGPVTSRLPS